MRKHPRAGGAPTPGFNNKIPEKILTLDTVETRIGTLQFVDGVPTDETAQTAYDNLDFLRGVEVSLSFIPAASVEAIWQGNAGRGASKSNPCVIHPPAMEFITASKVPYNTIHANNFEFYEELDHVIQRESLDLFDPEPPDRS